MILANMVLAQLPAQLNPTTGDAPPFVDNMTQIMGWALWVVLAICVIAAMAAGAQMAIASRRGEGGEHAARLGWVMAGAIVVGSASGIVNALII